MLEVIDLQVGEDIKKAVSDYGKTLTKHCGKELTIIPSALPESLLLYPKDFLKHAIAFLLLKYTSDQKRCTLEEAYLFLNNFIPDEEYDYFLSLETSGEAKGAATSSSAKEKKSKIKSKLREMNEGNKKSVAELKALRRIMNLPDDISHLSKN